MKRFRKPLIFTLALLPIAAVATCFVIRYQLDYTDEAMIEAMIGQVGSMEMVYLVSVIQNMIYVIFCGFFGYILADKIGLMKSVRFEKAAVLRTLFPSAICGIVFSMDYWSFGALIPGVREVTELGMTWYAWICAVLYGGIIEEVMLRLFMLSLIAWLIWKALYRKRDIVPDGVIIAANIIAAFLFAAAHLPATITMFGGLTPIILIRCFLLNGGFGLLFGRLYRKYGIQYAMLSHALLHIVSKMIWMVFI